MTVSLSKLQSILQKGQSEKEFLGKLESDTKETFTLKQEKNGSSAPYANKTRKYLGSKNSKIVTYVNDKGQIYGVATTAESL